MNYQIAFRSSVKEIITTSSGDDRNNSRNICRYKPKPPPRNPNITKTSNSYHVSNEILPYQGQHQQKHMTYITPRSVDQTSTLAHDQTVNNTGRLVYVTDKERIRDMGAEDADVSSQSSSSGVNVRSGLKPTSNLGKVMI